MKLTLASLLAPAAFLLVPALALADALPPDQCDNTKKAGDSCENAGAGGNKAGKCVDDTCNRIDYSADGGRGTAEYACLTCTVSEGSDGTTTDDGGCSTSPTTRDRLAGGTMLAIGLVAFGWSRRRRA